MSARSAMSAMSAMSAIAPRNRCQASFPKLLAASLLLIGPAVAGAAVLSYNFGDPTDSRYFTRQAYAEIRNPGDVILDDGGERHNDDIPLGAVYQNGILGANGTSVSYGTFASIDGFGLARTSASLQVSDASTLNGAYNVVASQGSRTQVQFVSDETPGQVVFNFSVTGNVNAPYGSAIGRLDFLARSYEQGTGSFFDVFLNPAALNASGPGNYSFTYLGSVANPLDVMFYSAAAVLVGLQDPASRGLPPNGATFTAFADFANTVNLTSIDLLTAEGAPITNWSLLDDETGETVFDQDGRVSAVPAPGTLGLLGLALGGLGLSRGRKIRRLA